MLAHALMMYTKPFPFPQSESPDWETQFFGDMPWSESFNKVIPQKPNAQALIRTFVLEANLPEEAEEDCLYPGDRMRFTHAVLNETSLDDHLLSVLAVEEHKPPFRLCRRDSIGSAEKIDSFAKTIISFRQGGDSTLPAKRVLIKDLVDGNIYSVSPKLLRKDR